MNDWVQWKQANANKIAHVMGYEEKFVDSVLSRIPELLPSDVVPQYQFFDAKWGKSYIDFMIINPSKGYLLPIELDGADKTDSRGKPNARHEDWNDFLDRQNALIRSFGVVLRYSNHQMFNNPNEIINQISKQLLAQEAAKRIDDAQRKVLSTTVPVQASPPSLPSTLPVAAIQASNPSQVAARRAFAASIALFSTLVLGYFVSQSSQYPAVREASAASASIRVKEVPPTSLAVSDAGSLSDNSISASLAQSYVGHHKLVCGIVAKIRETSAGLFINLERPYPNDVMSAIIWRKQLERIGRLQLSENQRVCISGLIQMHSGKTKIEIDHREQILL